MSTRQQLFMLLFLICVLFSFSMCNEKINLILNIETFFEVSYTVSDIDEINKEFFLADRGSSSIKIVNKSGEAIRIIGKMGQGPEEFGMGSPTCILISGEKIVVPDTISLSLKVLNIKGILLKQYRLTTVIPVFPILKLFPTEKDNLIGIYGYSLKGLTSQGPSISHKFIIFDLENGNIKEVYSTGEMVINTKAMNIFSGYVFPVINKNLVFHADKEDYKIEIFSLEGKKLSTIQRKTKLVRLTEEVKKYLEDNYDIAQIKAQGVNFIYPNNLPIIRTLISLNEFLIVWTWKSWYENNFERKDSKFYVDIFNINGNYIGEGIANFNPEEVIKIKGERAYLLCREGEKKVAKIGKISIKF